MKVGWVGLGKLGLPCAVALDAAGHEVVGYDVSPEPGRYLDAREVPYIEAGLPELLATHQVAHVDTVGQVVAHAEVIFVAVQTPHAPAYDGTQPAPSVRRDFEYGFLVTALRQIAAEADRQERPVTVAVVSTVLPGTFHRLLRPVVNGWVRLVYNPYFIAMGTTIADFTNPEFVLIGTDQPYDEQLEQLYRKVHQRPIRVVSVESAELTKVAYNVYLSAKIAFANYVGEIAHKTGADADEVTGSLALATSRIVSPAYMTAGMGDGGGCHPRDLIALSWLAERLDLSHDLAECIMDAREGHSGWLAREVLAWSDLTGLPIVVMGRAYKPESNLVAGSPSDLLVHQLEQLGCAEPVHVWDPLVVDEPRPIGAAVFMVATKHQVFAEQSLPAGSVVLDPFGYMPDQQGVTLVRIGRKGGRRMTEPTAADEAEPTVTKPTRLLVGGDPGKRKEDDDD